MKTKKFLICILFFVPLFTLNAQFLHLGLRTYITPSQKIKYFQYNINDYVYYFSNDFNETIRFSGFSESKNSSYIPFPSIFLRYDLSNNIFLQFDVASSWFANEAKYKNSVDFSSYADVFNPKSELPNLGYNSIKLKWSFMSNSFTAGYAFLKTKTIRPFIYAGISAYYLLNFKPGDYYTDTRRVRNEIIFNNLNTFKTVTFYSKLGAGFKYHGISLDVCLDDNLGAIDQFAPNSDDQNIYYTDRPNFKNLTTVSVALTVNLLSFNLIKNQSLR